MSEIVFDKLQLGLQTGTPAAPGAAVAATIIFPIDAGLIDPDLDRGYASPDEDYGVLSRHQAGRGSYGLRAANIPVTFVARFEDIMRFLEMRLAGGITPTGTDPYTWPYTADETSDSTKVYTGEIGSETSQDQYRLSTMIVTDLELSFGPLTAPGDHPLKVTATLQALNRTPQALTAALSAGASMETIEGHLSNLYAGSTATAFASLTEFANHLVSYRLRYSGARPYRPYGGATDVSTGYGLAKPEATVEMAVKVSATSKAEFLDQFEASGAVAPERRVRMKITGSNSREFRIDHRLRYEKVKRGERDGEAVYMITGHAVKDATLASALQAVVINHIAGPLT